MDQHVHVQCSFGNLDSRYIRIHIKLSCQDLNERSVEKFKLDIIEITNKSYHNFLSVEQADMEIQKCFFARSSHSSTYEPVSDQSVQGYPDSDIAFILTEGVAPLRSIAEEIELAKFQSEKFCLVFISDPIDQEASLTDHRNWLIEETLPVLQQLERNGCTIEVPLGSISVTLRRAYQVPATVISTSVSMIRLRKDATGNQYLTYVISVRNDGVYWDVEHRFSEFKQLLLILSSQSSSEIGIIYELYFSCICVHIIPCSYFNRIYQSIEPPFFAQ